MLHRSSWTVLTEYQDHHPSRPSKERHSIREAQEGCRAPEDLLIREEVGLLRTYWLKVHFLASFLDRFIAGGLLC